MQARTRSPRSRAPSGRRDRALAPRVPASAPGAPAGLLDVQRVVGNQAAGRLLRHDLINRKLAYDKDWLAWLGTAWATGAGDLWAKLQPKFDSEFSPAFERLEKLIASAAVEDSDQKKFETIRDTWGKYNSEKIPFAKGQELFDVLAAVTKSVTSLESAIKSSITTRVAAIEKSMTDVTAPFFVKYPTWSQMGIPGLKEANEARKKLVAELGSKKEPGTILSTSQLADLKNRVETTTASFVAAEGPAAAAQAKLEEDKSLKQAPVVTVPVTPEKAPVESLVKKVGGALAGSLRATGESDEAILKLLGLGTVSPGRLSEMFRYASAANIELLLAHAKDAALLKLLKAIGETGHEAELIQLLTLAPKQEDGLELLLSRAEAGSLGKVKDVLTLFPAGKTRAADAAALFGKSTKGQEASLHTVLVRVGVAEAPRLAAVLAKTTADKLDAMTDPAVGAHAFAFVHTELLADHKIWGGETCPEPAYKLANGTPVNLAHVRANAHFYGGGGGYPAPNTGMFSSDRFNNHGGTDMKLPTNTTYTEYDIREFTAPGDRGLARVVIGLNGKKYYTPDHYVTFFKF